MPSQPSWEACVDDSAVALEVCVENDPGALPIQPFGERVLAVLDSHPPEALAVEFNQVEGAATRFPMIAAAVEGLPVETCLIEGEAIVVDVNGLSQHAPLPAPRRHF
jgi:hypothetical protein